jgi:hypothetical protein
MMDSNKNLEAALTRKFYEHMLSNKIEPNYS